MNPIYVFILIILLVFSPCAFLLSEEEDTLREADLDRATREVDKPVLHDVAEDEWAVPQKPRTGKMEEGIEGKEVDTVTEDSPYYPPE